MTTVDAHPCALAVAPGAPGNGGNGGGGGTFGFQGDSGTICTLICGSIANGTAGGQGQAGGDAGGRQRPGMICSRYNGHDLHRVDDDRPVGGATRSAYGFRSR